MSNLNEELSEIEGWNRLLNNADFHYLEDYINNLIAIEEKRARDLSTNSPSVDNSVAASHHQYGAKVLRIILKRKIYIRERFGQLKKEKQL